MSARSFIPNLSWLNSLRSGDGAPPPAQRARVAEHAQTPPSALTELPIDLWRSILAAVETGDNPCDEVVRLCAIKREWAEFCRDGTIFDAANLRLGWYGPHPSWAAVQQHYIDAGAYELAPASARDYFKATCRERAKLVAAIENKRRIHKLGAAREALGHRRPHAQMETDDDGEEGDLRMSHHWKENAAIARAGTQVQRLVAMEVHPYAAYLIRFALQEDGMLLVAISGGWRETPIYPSDPNVAEVESFETELLPRHPDYDELREIALTSNGHALIFSRESEDAETALEKNIALARLAVPTCGDALSEIPGSTNFVKTGPDGSPLPPVDDFYELATAAVKQDGAAIRWVPTSHPGYDDLAKIAVQTNGGALSWVRETYDGDFAALARLAVQQNGIALQWVFGAKDDVTGEVTDAPLADFCEIAALAVANNGWALAYVKSSSCPTSYFEIAKTAVQQNALAIRYVTSMPDRRILHFKGTQEVLPYTEYAELVRIALASVPDAKYFVDPSALGWRRWWTR
jgi:hypothetical protein